MTLPSALDGSTIVALATPPGWSRSALVRISGPHAPVALGVLGISAPVSRGVLPARATVSTRFGPRDLPVGLVTYRAPASMTGEEVAELLIPGSPILADRLMDAMTAVPGVRRARAGEFTARAYLNGRLTPAQAEGVARSIASATVAEARAAHELLASPRESAPAAREVMRLLALVEAGIDFSDQEDVRAIAPRELRSRLLGVARDLAKAAENAGGRGVPGGVPVCVLAGRTNAGKSSLFNALLGARRAVASPTPGSTRDALREEIELPGAGRVELVDLPGLDAAGSTPSDPIARAARDNALAVLSRADLVLHCDPLARFEPLEANLDPSVPVVRVVTMADLGLPRAQTASVSVSAHAGWGLEEVRRTVAAAVLRAGPGWSALGLELGGRRREACARAAGLLREAADLAGADDALTADAMRGALDVLADLEGPISADAVLGLIFSTFCVGK